MNISKKLIKNKSLIVMSVLICFSLAAVFFVLPNNNKKCLSEPDLQELQLLWEENGKNEESKVIQDYIIHQFDAKASRGVTQKDLDKMWDNRKIREELFISRFQIIDQKLYADSQDNNFLYYKILVKYLYKILQKNKIKDVDFVFLMRDGIQFDGKKLDKTISQIPAFMMSKDTNLPYEKDMLLLPDAFMMEDKWAELVEEIKQANMKNEWRSKIDKIFWRGNPSGSIDLVRSDTISNRFRLVILSKIYPYLIDAKLSKTPYEIEDIVDYNAPGGIKEAFKVKTDDDQRKLDLYSTVKVFSGKKPEFISEVDHLKYKYLISIDGHTCAWRRLPWIMLSNSVLLKQQSSKVEWFYSAMKPYVHYVPVEYNLNDIFSIYSWLKNNDDAIEIISKNAQKFIENNLMPQNIESHTVNILNEYSKLHKGAIILPSLPEIKGENIQQIR